ncbi:MAG: SDR family NAD(P)-dependent oxidoreductase, partial [Micromonosporaceae bacterium]
MRQVIVTGGGTGIGYAIAASFIESGDRVTITGRRTDVLEAAAEKLGATPVAFDASDPDEVRAALGALPNRVDVLVNNAGGNTNRSRTGAADGDLVGLAADWQANLDANLMSAVLVTAALTPRLADHARIVTIGSIAARGSGSGSYGAAKAAVESWSADLASELGTRGITSNVVSPGLTVDTEFFRGQLTDERTARLVAATRNGRAGTPDDIAATVRFLA